MGDWLFSPVLRFPPQKKNDRHHVTIVESGVKHHKPTLSSTSFPPFNIYIFQFFSRSNSFKCSGCNLMLSNQEFVRRVHGNVYHQTCFQCACCERPLQTGEKIYLRDDDKLVCAEDYDAWKTKG